MLLNVSVANKVVTINDLLMGAAPDFACIAETWLNCTIFNDLDISCQIPDLASTEIRTSWRGWRGRETVEEDRSFLVAHGFAYKTFCI